MPGIVQSTARTPEQRLQERLAELERRLRELERIVAGKAKA